MGGEQIERSRARGQAGDAKRKPGYQVQRVRLLGRLWKYQI